MLGRLLYYAASTFSVQVVLCMRKLRFLALPLVLAMVSGISGYFLQRHFYPEVYSQTTEVAAKKVAKLVGQQRPAIRLPDLQGKPRDLDEWRGKVLMINFWASWCPPCRKEIPDFIRLQDDYADAGLQVVGVAVDELEPVKKLAEEFGINYPSLVESGNSFPLLDAYGNPEGLLPQTIVVDADGMVRANHRGRLTYNVARDLIEPLLDD